MRGSLRLLLVYALMRTQVPGTASPLAFLYRKGGLLEPEEVGVISLRCVCENLPTWSNIPQQNFRNTVVTASNNAGKMRLMN